MIGTTPPKQARVLTWASLCWLVRSRAWTPYHLVRYWRYARLRLTRPHIITEGMVFLGKGVELYARHGHARLVIGKFVHIGDHTAVRAHEGTVRIGDKAVLASRVTVNSYLHVEIGPATLVGDDVYICDFDHRFDALDQPIKDQGIVKAPVRIGQDVWLGTKATVLRGTDIGDGCVIGANAVVTRDVPAYSVAAGVPAAILKSRLPEPAGRDGAPTASPLIGDFNRLAGIDRADAARRPDNLGRRPNSGP